MGGGSLSFLALAGKEVVPDDSFWIINDDVCICSIDRVHSVRKKKI